MKLKIFTLFLLFSNVVFSQETRNINLQPGEKVWTGVINDGQLMPFSKDYSMDFYGNNKSNQIQPLILTSNGQYAWSPQPFRFELKGDKITINDPYNQVVIGKSGNSLAEAQRHVRNSYFPATGKLPDTLLFSKPQYNTWIELTYNQNQSDVIKYAQGILDNGFPPGVLMIDDTWQEDYGLWRFHPGRFSNPKAMVDQLHSMGFKVMLWICPFVSADQAAIYNLLKKSKAFLLEKKSDSDTWQSVSKPLMIEWWNGQSAVLDFSNPAAVGWFNGQLDGLVKNFGIDGFKFDAGDTKFYPSNGISKGNVTPNEQSELFTQFGMRFPLNEYRACWKMGGQPLAQRLQDKSHNWTDLQKLIPNMIVEGLSGYAFSCPDLIGGGDWVSFLDETKLDRELVVRSAQCHALMPMMQFSVAPWRILTREQLEAVKQAVSLREKFTPLIMKLAHEAAKTGEPILKSMEYVFPNQGYAEIRDQFMLGNELLVAPMLAKGKTIRTVVLPKGTWVADDGKKYQGGKIYDVEVPLNRIPYFRISTNH
ncbi:MAG: glycoside hydrolase family 31 protein [Prolixibacteraceae bacterium]